MDGSTQHEAFRRPVKGACRQSSEAIGQVPGKAGVSLSLGGFRRRQDNEDGAHTPRGSPLTLSALLLPRVPLLNALGSDSGGLVPGRGERTLECSGWEIQGSMWVMQEMHVWAILEMTLSTKPKLWKLLGGRWQLQMAPSRMFACSKYPQYLGRFWRVVDIQ